MAASSPKSARRKRRLAQPLSTAILLVGIVAGSLLLLQGLAVSYDTANDTPPPAGEPKPDITISYTLNNVGYIEPCG